MNPWYYLVMLGWVAGGVSRWKKTGIWLLVLVAVALAGLVTVTVALRGSVWLSFPYPIFSVGTLVSIVVAIGLFASALLQGGSGDKKAKGKQQAGTIEGRVAVKASER